MAHENDQSNQGKSIRQRGFDVAKMFARRALQQVTQKIIKQITKLAMKLIVKALVKFLVWVGGALLIKGIVIVLCIVLFAGAAIYVGHSFGWIEDESKIPELQARYSQAAASTSDMTRYQVPIWLLQHIDNIRILKEDREPGDIDPESIANTLKVEISNEDKVNSFASWSVDNGNISSKTSRIPTFDEWMNALSATQEEIIRPLIVDKDESSTTLIKEVKTWNRIISYKYVLLTNSKVLRDTVEVTGDQIDGGTITEKSEDIFNHWELDQTEVISSPDGKTTRYHYKLYQDRNESTTVTTLTPVPKEDEVDTEDTSTETIENDSVQESEESDQDEDGFIGTRDSSSYTSTWYFTSTDSEQEQIYEDSYLTTTKYHYETSTSSGGSSREVREESFDELTEEEYEYHEEYSYWHLSEINEISNFDKLNESLVYFGFTQSDFHFLQDAIEQSDPELLSIQGYDTSHLLADEFTGGGSSYTGGIILDSPNIPGSDEWAFPTSIDAVITSGFGYRVDPINKTRKLHKGIDLARSNKKIDYPIYAVSDGIVEWAGFNNNGYGYFVIIDHGDGIKTRYAHLQANSLQVKENDTVKKGKALGMMGTTGRSTGVHLHFEVFIDGKVVNPAGYLRR